MITKIKSNNSSIQDFDTYVINIEFFEILNLVVSSS